MKSLDDIQLTKTKEERKPQVTLPEGDKENADIKNVLDGDTIDLEDGRRIRLYGIDAPETGKFGERDQAGAQEATQELKKLLDGNTSVGFINSGKGVHGRTLATILDKDGKDIQEVLIESGKVRAMSIKRNEANSTRYAELEQKARQSKLGIWKKPFRAVPKQYVPSFMRGDSSEGVAAATLGEAIAVNVKQDGLLTQTARMLSDMATEDRRDKEAGLIVKMLPSLMKDAKLPAYYQDQIQKDAKSLDHAKELVKRAEEVEETRASMEAMPFGRAAGAGVLGFIADPTNFIPGFLLIKASKLLGKVPAIAKTAPKVLRTDAAKVAAFAATEEALRTAPRLQADPTYQVDNYIANIGIASALGAGTTKVPFVGGWLADKLVKKPFKALQSSVSEVTEAVQESVQLRTTMNVMQQASNLTKDRNIEKYRKAATESPVQLAQNKAKVQVEQSKFLNRAKQVGTRIKEAFSKDTEIENTITPVRENMADLVNRVQELENPELLQAKTKALSTLIREETEEVTATVTPKQAMDDLAEVTQAVEAVAASLKNKPKEALMLRAALQDAQQAVEERLVQIGHKVVQRKATEVDLKSAIKQKLQAVPLTNRFNKVDTAFKRVANKMDFIEDAPASADQVFNKIRTDLDLTGETNSTSSLEDIINYVLARPNELNFRAGTVKQRTSTELFRLRQNIQDAYNGSGSDKDLLDLLEQVDKLETEIVSTLEWVVLANTKKTTDTVKLDAKWALLSNEFEESIGKSKDEIEKLYNKASQRAVKGQFGRLTRSLGTDLINTKVPLAQYQAINIFELAPGTGGIIERPQTAAMIASSNHDKIMFKVRKDYLNFLEKASTELGHGVMKRAYIKRANPNVDKDLKEILQMVEKEINNRDIGRTSQSPDFVKDYANKIAESNNALYELQAKHSVDGITGANKRKHYQRQKWNDSELLNLLNDPRVGKNGLVKLFTQSLQTGKSKLNADDAVEFATAAINIKLSKLNSPKQSGFTLDAGNDTNKMPTIDAILERLSQDGKNAAIDRVVKSLNLAEPDGTSSFARARVLDIDYSTTVNIGGQEVKMIDLLDNDVAGLMERYSKEATGIAALSEASGGRLTSLTDVDNLLNATTAQAHELGTHVNTGDLRNAYRQLLGMPFDGQLPVNWRKIRDMVALAGMGGLGESQLAEAGLAMSRGLSGLTALNQVTHKTTGRIKQWAGMTLTKAQANDKEFVEDLMEHSRLYEDMHIMQAQNVHFDDRKEAHTIAVLDKLVDGVTGGKFRPYLQYLQTRYTGYGAVRNLEEQLAITGLMQDATKFALGRKSHGSEARFRDLGLDTSIIKKYIDNGTVVLNAKGKVEAMNMHAWSEADSQAIGIAMRRHAGQVVQKGFVGELSPLMANPTVAFMMQFKSYPILAAEKQQARQLMFHDKEAAFGIAINAVSSGIARVIRYQSMALALPEEKREAYMRRKLENDLGHDTLAYMGIAGMLVNVHDITKDLVFGKNPSIGEQLPVINWMDNQVEAVKAANPFDDQDLTERQLGTIQRAAPIGTIGLVNIIMGIIRDAMKTDTKKTYKENTNRGN